MQVLGLALADAVLRADGTVGTGHFFINPRFQEGVDLVPIPRSVANIQMEVRVAHMSIPRDVDVQMLQS